MKDSRPISRLITLAALVAISGCAVAANSGVRAKPAAVISQASGTFQITNSRDAQAVFQAQGLAPGRSVTGTVQLSNTGTLAGDLGLDQLDVVDQPGTNGGRLSDPVHLDVQDVTGGNLVPVFAGQLDSLQNRALGNIAPGEARTYRFTASLPDGGPPPTPTSGDNAYAGSALTVRYAWKATAGGIGPSEIVPPKTSFRVVARKLLRRGWLDVMVSCNRACNVSAWARVPKAIHARKAVKFARRSAALPLPGRTARIRLTLSPRSVRELRAALRTKPRVNVHVGLSVVSAAWSAPQRYSKKVVVKRSTKNHAGPRKPGRRP